MILQISPPKLKGDEKSEAQTFLFHSTDKNLWHQKEIPNKKNFSGTGTLKTSSAIFGQKPPRKRNASHDIHFKHWPSREHYGLLLLSLVPTRVDLILQPAA